MKEKNQQASFFNELGCFMKPYKGKYAVSVIISILSVGAGIGAYAFAGKIVSMLLETELLWSKVFSFAVSAIICKLLNTVLLNLSTWISHKTAYFTMRDIRNALSEKMLRLPVGYFEENGSGRQKSLLVDHVEEMEKTLAHMLPEMTTNLLAPLCCNMDYHWFLRYLWNIDALTKDKTVIMIAHRIKSVEKADYIIALKNGRIVQEGTHEDLKGVPGLYVDFLASGKEAAQWKLNA